MDRLDEIGERLARLEERVTEPTLFSKADLALMLGCSTKTIDRRVANGTLPAPITFAGLKRWRLSDLEATR